MESDKLNSLGSRAFFLIALALLAIAVIERIVNFGGYTVLRGLFDAGRLLEYAAVLLMFVMALLLRQVRDGVRKG